MALMSLIAANAGRADLIVGILIGGCLGFLAGPSIRSWLTHREWEAASREARVAAQLLDRMEDDADRVGRLDGDAGAGRRTWRTQP